MLAVVYVCEEVLGENEEACACRRKGLGAAWSLEPGAWSKDQVARSISEAAPRHYILKIMSFSSLAKTGIEKYESEEFDAGGYKWTIQLFPKGRRHGSGTHISIYLALVDSDTPKDGSKIFAEFTLRMKDQQQSRHIAGKVSHWFSESSKESGWEKFVSLAYFYHTSSGCLVNDTCTVEAEVTVHAVAHTL
ncbi:hypothetical protein V6N13_050906 [Hibiscus sabdariffa]